MQIATSICIVYCHPLFFAILNLMILAQLQEKVVSYHEARIIANTVRNRSYCCRSDLRISINVYAAPARYCMIQND
jgi:hypothetical protein